MDIRRAKDGVTEIPTMFVAATAALLLPLRERNELIFEIFDPQGKDELHQVQGL